jgi:hypothetical protein
MRCPRCGGQLTIFRLGDSETMVCDSCEYVGIPADHRAEPAEEPESWEEALDRFHGDGEDAA